MKLCPICKRKGFLCGDYDKSKDVLDLYIACENKDCDLRTGKVRVKNAKSKKFIIKKLEKDWDTICSSDLCFCDQSFINIIVNSVCKNDGYSDCKGCVFCKSLFPFCEGDDICKVIDYYFSLPKEKQEELWNKYMELPVGK